VHRIRDWSKLAAANSITVVTVVYVDQINDNKDWGFPRSMGDALRRRKVNLKREDKNGVWDRAPIVRSRGKVPGEGPRS